MEFVASYTRWETFSSEISEHILVVLGSILLIFVSLLYYMYIVLPTNWVKNSTNDHCIRKHRGVGKCVFNDLRQTSRRRGTEDLPPVYPNGWFALLESRMVRAGRSVSVSALGREFTVFRGEDQRAYVFDAFCPHLGASFNAGGKVVGNCIQCPFHGWLFRGIDGQCVKIPYMQTVPEFVRTKSWPVSEKNGFIFFWHDSENEDPTWMIPDVPEVNHNIWRYIGRTEHTVHCHIQDIAENGADSFHLNQIHADSALLGSTVGQQKKTLPLLNWLQHEWSATWEPSGHPQRHIAWVKLQHRSKILGYCLNFLRVTLHIQQVGPGVVLMHFESPTGEGIFIQCVTPQSPLEQRLIHHLYTSPSVPKIIAKIYILVQAIMIERDVMIWNKKKYLKAPMLMKEERLISRFRKWYSQFYAANSPTIQSLASESLDW